MSGRLPQIVDARGHHPAAAGADPSLPPDGGLPPREDLPPREVPPQLLTNEPVLAIPDPNPPAHGLHRRRNNTPIAAMPTITPGRPRSALAARAAAAAAAVVGVVLLAVGGRHHHPPPPQPLLPQAAAHAATAGGSLGPQFGSTLPLLGGGSIPVPPVRLVIAIPRGLRRELASQLSSLRAWLLHNEQLNSTIQVLSESSLDTVTAREKIIGLPALGIDTPTTQRRALTQIDTALRGFLPVFVSIQQPTAPARRGVYVGHIRLAHGIVAPTASVTSLAVHDGIAASVALQVADATGQTVTASPRLDRSSITPGR